MTIEGCLKKSRTRIYLLTDPQKVHDSSEELFDVAIGLLQSYSMLEQIAEPTASADRSLRLNNALRPESDMPLTFPNVTNHTRKMRDL